MNIKIHYWALFALCFSLWSCGDQETSSTLESAETISDNEVIPGNYIVVFKEDAIAPARVNEPTFTVRSEKMAYAEAIRIESEEKMEAFFTEVQLAPSHVTATYTAALTGFAAKLTEAELDRIKSDPRVDFVEEDRMITLDFEVEEIFEESELSLSSGRTLDQTVPCGITEAGGYTNSSSSSSRIWIVDTGIDLDHPDLNVDVSLSRAFQDSSPDDSNGHGTHVAGTAAAIANSIGVVGVSAGAPVVAVDVLASGGAPTSTIVRGMDYIAGRDVRGDVVNMSLGPRYRSGCGGRRTAYRSALNRLNNQSVIALAAGNSEDDASFYDPGCQNMTRVYTVASMTCSGSMSWFSNYGSPVDYIATGSDVLSTYPGGRYATISGTSMASPTVAGILHARGGYNARPRSCGSVTDSYGYTYPIACR